VSYPLDARADARADALLIAEDYDAIRPDLAQRFRQQLKDVFETIKQRPTSYPVALKSKQVRRVLMDDFPYAVYFQFDGSASLIFAVVHTARRRSAWRKRLD